MLICENIILGPQRHPAIMGLGFCLPPESVMVLPGECREIKTRLLEIFAGFRKPAAGEVCWQGAPIRNARDYQQAMLFLERENRLKPNLSVKKNLLRMARQGEPALLPATAQYLKFTPLLEIPCRELSISQQRLLAMARLLLRPAPLWLLDEPEAGLDEEGLSLFGGLIESRIRSKGIVVMTTGGQRALPLPADKTCMLRVEDFYS